MGDLVSNLSPWLFRRAGPANLGLAFLGCLVGTLIGVLPGVGAVLPLPCYCRSPSDSIRSAP